MEVVTKTPRVSQRGFTLMELMTVVVIVGILAAIAVPSYRNYLVRTQRTDAKTALLRVQAAQEKFYLQNNAYTNVLAALPPAGLGLSNLSENGYYTIAVALLRGDQGFSATATPVAGGGQDDDTQCTQFSINDAGVREAQGPGGTVTCWR